jgi:hypothetical protein
VAAPDPSERLPVQPGEQDLEGIDIDILEDGTVRLHTTCQPGQDPRECARRLRFLVEALGIPVDRVVTDLTVDGSTRAAPAPTPPGGVPLPPKAHASR